MGLTAPMGIYGLWSVTFKDRVSKLPLALIKVAAEFTFPHSADMEDYVGGGSKFVLASEPKYIKADAAFNIKQFNPETFTYLAAGTQSVGTAESAGAVTTLTNAKGTSIVNATTGIASVALKSGSAADLKAGTYTVLATSATAVDVYCDTDIDFGGIWTSPAGTAETFVNDTCKITAAPLTITTSGALSTVTGFGVDLVGGSGTIALVAGDTATFEVRPANVINETVTFGDRNTHFKSYSVTAYSVPKSLTGEIFYLYMPIVQVSGLDLSLKEYAWVGSSPKLKVLRSDVENMNAKLTRVQRMYA
jgi:hypothetical protein